MESTDTALGHIDGPMEECPACVGKLRAARRAQALEEDLPDDD